eukprot:m.215388 g.215388  ORF g.215388 m.215388 type:complete len:135 (+) comp19096_c1_seq1:300-704(+)
MSTSPAQLSDDVGTNDADPPPEFCCQICLELMYEPYVTPCEHRFCRGCIKEWLRRDSRNGTCPTCRQPLHLGPDLQTCTELEAEISTQFPHEYAMANSEDEARRKEARKRRIREKRQEYAECAALGLLLCCNIS